MGDRAGLESADRAEEGVGPATGPAWQPSATASGRVGPTGQGRRAQCRAAEPGEPGPRPDPDLSRPGPGERPPAGSPKAARTSRGGAGPLVGGRACRQSRAACPLCRVLAGRGPRVSGGGGLVGVRARHSGRWVAAARAGSSESRRWPGVSGGLSRLIGGATRAGAGSVWAGSADRRRIWSDAGTRGPGPARTGPSRAGSVWAGLGVCGP